MNRLSFALARLRRDEGKLAALSVPQSELLADYAGRSVALIGNARGLADARLGEMIETADLIIRINRAPKPFAHSHGTRTDQLALAVALDAAKLDALQTRRVLWMSHKRKRLPWHVANRPGFYLHPQADYERLKTALGSQPTTGAMMIDLLARSDARRIDLYGFDFFATLSLTGSRTAEQVPHDFNAEAAWVHALIARDPRFRLHSHG
ncbi:glycosyltransferase family 29 protein [Falsirhodobacter xinxiangensis]|uniref:glycosyltransferase family 29 protein n=1 Tax=Falsirhodobacter xinxiangensis TaxID=2530049 RepID=UPI0010AA01AF|nr:glycosyltransferase family 29 protein [Rhodobacter xinxiangensis]